MRLSATSSASSTPARRSTSTTPTRPTSCSRSCVSSSTDLRAAGIDGQSGQTAQELSRSPRRDLRADSRGGGRPQDRRPGGIVEALDDAQTPAVGPHATCADLLEGRSLKTLYDAINVEVLPAATSLARRPRLCRRARGRRPARPHIGRGRPPRQAVLARPRQAHRAWTATSSTPRRSSTPSAAPAQRSIRQYGEILGLPLMPVTAADPDAARASARADARIAVRRIEGCGTTSRSCSRPARSTSSCSCRAGMCGRCFCSSARRSSAATSCAPLTRAHTSGVIEGLAAQYLDPLGGPERDVALVVHETRQKPDDEAMLESLPRAAARPIRARDTGSATRLVGLNPLLGPFEARSEHDDDAGRRRDGQRGRVAGADHDGAAGVGVHARRSSLRSARRCSMRSHALDRRARRRRGGHGAFARRRQRRRRPARAVAEAAATGCRPGGGTGGVASLLDPHSERPSRALGRLNFNRTALAEACPKPLVMLLPTWALREHRARRPGPVVVALGHVRASR